MKAFISFSRICFIALSIYFPIQSAADFGEIDLIVEESIEAHFREYRKSVDLSRLSYIEKPTLQGDRLLIRSSVWAEQRLISPYWGWHDCTTILVLKGPGRYEDKGSDCYFQFD